MAVSPTVDEVQDAVMKAWTSACVVASPPPAVLDSLVFFHPRNGLTAIAIVDVHGENTYRCGAHAVRTIHHETPLARQISECRVGECISHAGMPLMLVARDGGPLADHETCRSVMALSDQISRRSAALAELQDQLEALLARCMEDLRDKRLCGANRSYSAVLEAEKAHCDAIVELEMRLAHLRVQHTVRSLAHLEECMDAEADALNQLQRDIQAEIASLQREMAMP